MHNDCFLYLQIKDKDFVREYPEEGLLLRPGQRRDVRRRSTSPADAPGTVAVEDLFRFLIVFGLQAAAIYAVAAERPGRHLRDLGHLQLRPRRDRDAGRVQLLGARGRTAAGPAGSALDRCVLFVEAPLLGLPARPADHAEAGRRVDDHDDRGHDRPARVVRVPGRDHLAAGHVDTRAARVLRRATPCRSSA